MSQSKRASFGESIVSTAIGFVVSMLILEAVNQVWRLALSMNDNFLITCIFTAASIARTYLVRRAFNWMHNRGERLVEKHSVVGKPVN